MMKRTMWALLTALSVLFFGAMPAAAEDTTLCSYSAGPKSGQTEDVSRTLTVGRPCNDGFLSFGTAVVDDGDDEEDDEADDGDDDDDDAADDGDDDDDDDDDDADPDAPYTP